MRNDANALFERAAPGPRLGVETLYLAMLTLYRKEKILRKAGIPVPPFPARRLPLQERHMRDAAKVPQEERDADAEQRDAVQAWRQAVDALHAALAEGRLSAARPESS